MLSLKIALIISVIIQFVTAFIAISLIRRTRTNIAWWLISFGFLFMAIRRMFELFQVFDTDNNIVNSLTNSWIGVGVSIIMLLSLSFIKRIFNIQKRIDELKKQNETRVFSAIIKTEENERHGFAKELHDGLGPLLSSVKMMLSSFSDKIENGQNKEVLKNAEHTIDESITSLKEISNKLSPHVLNNFGLLKAVKSFINKLHLENRPEIHISQNIEDRRFSYNVEVVIYRVFCELITNTLKHADANNIYIDFFVDDEKLHVKYMDDGIGFEPDKIFEDSHGMGYANIESRIKSIKGHYQTFTSTNAGFNMYIIINLR